MFGNWNWNTTSAYKRPYETIEDFKTHIEYFNYLYSGGWGGFFTRSQIINVNDGGEKNGLRN